MHREKNHIALQSKVMSHAIARQQEAYQLLETHDTTKDLKDDDGPSLDDVEELGENTLKESNFDKFPDLEKGL